MISWHGQGAPGPCSFEENGKGEARTYTLPDFHRLPGDANLYRNQPITLGTTKTISLASVRWCRLLATVRIKSLDP